MNQRCCIECHQFDRATERTDERSLVRCLDERNRDGIWPRLVRSGMPACRHFQEHAGQ